MHSETYKQNMKQWREVMQDHARLSRALKQKARARADAYQQRKFKADKRKFSKALFEKKSCGEPVFPQEKGFEYFSNLYRDEKRDEAVDPLPEMKSKATIAKGNRGCYSP